MRTTRFLSAALSAMLLLTAAACGSDDDDGSGDNAGRAVVTTTTTAAATTTTAAGATTTTPATTAAGTSDLSGGPNFVTTDGPSGAGCSPGQTDTLTAGWWAGEIESVGDSSIDFDLVCFFVGDAAVQAAGEDGSEVTDDYYVRNSNPRTFSIEFSSGSGPSSCTGFDPEPFDCTVDDVLTLYRTTDTTGTSVLDGHEVFPFPLVWVHITGTTGDYLYMQYTP